MNAQEQIETYIACQPEPKRSEMQELHDIILQVSPGCKQWFLDGKDSDGGGGWAEDDQRRKNHCWQFVVGRSQMK